jgi:hypothetical protein
MDRKLVVAFTVLVAVTTAFAIGSIVWFGPDAHLANIPGVSADRALKSPSVWILFAVPAGLAILGALAAVLLPWPKLEYLSEDAQRGLGLYRNAGRVFFIGVGALFACLQAFAILRTAGIALPPEFDLRAFYFGFGVLLAYAGNFTPKMPALPDRWLGASGFVKAYRFAGWVFTIGGILMCFAAVVVPAEEIPKTTQKLIYAAVGLPIHYCCTSSIVRTTNQHDRVDSGNDRTRCNCSLRLFAASHLQIFRQRPHSKLRTPCIHVGLIFDRERLQNTCVPVPIELRTVNLLLPLRDQDPILQ